jgi:hypothetical protein
VIAAATDGQVLLAVADRQVPARSLLPLPVGQHLQLEVVRTTPFVELRLLGQSPVISDEAFAVATLQIARQAVPAGPPAAALAALLIEASAGNPEAAATATVIAERVTALGAGDPGQLAAQLQQALERGGLLLETQLRAWLHGGGNAAAGVPPHLTDDLRVLLARLAAALGRPMARGGPGFPATGAAADLARASAGQPEAGATGHALEQMAAGTLRRQAQVAYDWVRHGVLRLDLPVLTDHGAVDAHVRLEPDDSSDAATERRTGSRPCALTVSLSLDPVGRIDIDIRMAPGHLHADIVVERDEVGAWAAAEVSDLTRALRAAGCGDVSTTIRVDAERLAARGRADPDDPPPDGGSILNARA